MSKYPFPNPEAKGVGTNWIDTITRTALYQNYDLSISGASAKSSYYASAGFNETQGIIDNSGLKRYSARLKVDHEFAKWLKAGLNLSYTYRDQDENLATIGGNFQSSLETTSLLKELGAKLVVSRAERDVQAKFLLRNGADEVVYPEKQLAKWAAIRYSSEHILDYIELQDDHAIMEVTIPPEWMDRTIGEINIRKKYNINILALKKDGNRDMNITPDTRLCRDESMLVLGKHASIQKCFRL